MANEPAATIAGKLAGSPAAAPVDTGGVSVEVVLAVVVLRVGSTLSVDCAVVVEAGALELAIVVTAVDEDWTEWIIVIVMVAVVVLVEVTVSSAAAKWGATRTSAAEAMVRKRILAISCEVRKVYYQNVQEKDGVRSRVLETVATDEARGTESDPKNRR